MDNKKKSFLFDKRIIDKNIKSKKITKKDIELYIKSLPDLKTNCEILYKLQ